MAENRKLISNKKLCEKCNQYSSNLIKPCQCDIWQHRNCFTQDSPGTHCQICGTKYLFEYPFLQTLIRDEQCFHKWFMIFSCLLFIISVLFISHILKLTATVEIFYLIIILCSLLSCLFEYNWGLTPQYDNLFSMNPQHIDRFIHSIGFLSIIARQYSLNFSNWYICDRA